MRVDKPLGDQIFEHRGVKIQNSSSLGGGGDVIAGVNAVIAGINGEDESELSEEDEDYEGEEAYQIVAREDAFQCGDLQHCNDNNAAAVDDDIYVQVRTNYNDTSVEREI